tara:strand:+ start:958 stop:3180 length:2223 start_codon:yes stop_codon:yes gene_type:complete
MLNTNKLRLNLRLPAAACLTLSASCLLPSQVQADSVSQLAQGCYAIQSPQSGKYLSLNSRTTRHNYHFGTSDVDDAGHFFFKPAEQGVFLLTDQQGDYLSKSAPFRQSAEAEPGPAAEWLLSEEAGLYSLRNAGTGTLLRHSYSPSGSARVTTVTDFVLEPQSDCTDYPEMTLSAQPAGLPQYAEDSSYMFSMLTGDASEPVRGYVDAHSHLGSSEFLAGAIPGDSFHRYGVAHALDACDQEHGPNGRLDIIGGGGKPHDTSGWPAFTDWPAYSSLGHSTYYYKWLERAHLSGLRMMVVYMVENQVLCEVQTKVNPASWGEEIGSCDTMDSVFHQIDTVNSLIDYVDAQYGGPGEGFLARVTTPAEAREAIAAGKLALLYGVEASEVLDCGEKDSCDEQQVDENLDALYDAGVRVMYPVHKFDNHFGGANTRNSEDELVHLGQRISTGHYVETENCDDHVADYDGAYVRGFEYDSGIPALPELPDGVIGDFINDLGPEYPEGIEQCNRKGLTALGAYLVNRMIDKKMIIDLDHISVRAAVTIMDIVESRHYSGVVSTHNWMMKGKDGPLDTDTSDDPFHEAFLRIARSGGYMSPLNKDSDTLIPLIEQYMLAHLQALYPALTRTQLLAMLTTLQPQDIPGVGFGADMSGLATQARPNGKNPGYPFVNEFGIQFDRQGESNGRQFDLASDGVAQYGMLADHVALLRQEALAAGKPYVYESFMNSAEQYLKMWERTEQTQSF